MKTVVLSQKALEICPSELTPPTPMASIVSVDCLCGLCSGPGGLCLVFSPGIAQLRSLPFSSVSESEIQSGNRVVPPMT